MAEHERTSIEADDRYHHYSGNRIPWFVRVMWIGFWTLTIVYSLRYIFPAIQSELFPK